MHSARSLLWRITLSAGCLLILLTACSFMASPGSPTSTAQRATTVVTATSSANATPTPRVSSAALLTYSAHRQAIYALAWSPNGKLIASGSADTTVRVWDATTGKTTAIYGGHKTGVTTVAWSPDGARIASGSGYMPGSGGTPISDNVVQVWDAQTGQTLLTYRGHAMFLNTVAWSPDGTRIASASDDGTVRIWDARTGKTFLVYTGQTTPGGRWPGRPMAGVSSREVALCKAHTALTRVFGMPRLGEYC